MTPAVQFQTELQAQLAATARHLAEVLPPEVNSTIDAGIVAITASGIAANSRTAGELAPDFTLPNVAGEPVSLSALLEDGPVVLTFYRGAWCPYCDVQLRAYQRAVPTFATYGATLVAISPQTPDNSLSTAEKKELAFAVLSDQGSQVAERYGLAYEVGPEVYAALASVGIDLSAFNGDPSGRLPLTGTFVIDRNGVIAWAWVEANFKQRADPEAIVAALAALA